MNGQKSDNIVILIYYIYFIIMTILSLIVGIILGAITVVFALQNVVPITVIFLSWQIHGSLALILVLAVLLGAVICALFSIPELIDIRMQLSAAREEIKRLELEKGVPPKPTFY